MDLELSALDLELSALITETLSVISSTFARPWAPRGASSVVHAVQTPPHGDTQGGDTSSRPHSRELSWVLDARSF